MGWGPWDTPGAPEVVRIPVHGFQAILGEYARGNITGAQAQAAITAISGEALTAGEVTEVQALLAKFTGTAAVKLALAKRLDDVLLLAERRAVYATPAQVRATLGV
jgi:hypothetical protein